MNPPLTPLELAFIESSVLAVINALNSQKV